MAHPLLLLLFAYLLQLLATASPVHSPSCSPKACGNLTISYPFWLDEPGRPPCGPPSFQIKCNSSGAFLRHSSFESYRVVSIFNENSSFHVVDETLPLATGCPAPPFNISLGIGLAPFVISEANTQLLFLSSCKEPVTPAGFRRLSCGNNSFVRLGGEGELARQSVQEGIPRGCHFSVVPILGAYDGNGDDYVARMRNGFLLEWEVVSGDCPKCSASGGECRYNDQGLGFACNCAGSMRPDKCGSSEVNLPTTHRRFSNSPPLWVSALVPNLMFPMAPGFIFLFLVWAWWLPLILATATRAAEEQVEGCSAKTCGNLTISDPFWITRKDTERPIAPTALQFYAALQVQASVTTYYCSYYTRFAFPHEVRGGQVRSPVKGQAQLSACRALGVQLP